MHQETKMVMFCLLNSLFFILFLFSAYLQLNDIDPLLWILIYAAGALTCLCAFLAPRISYWLSILLSVIGLAWSGFLIWEFIQIASPLIWKDVFTDVKMKTLKVELAREIGGLWIIIAWMLAITIHHKPNQQQDKKGIQ